MTGPAPSEGKVPDRTPGQSGPPRRALLLGASGGIGSALESALAESGWEVVGFSRRDGMDVTDPDSLARSAATLAGQSFDLIFNATGGLEIGGRRPERSLAEIDADAMAAQFALNATGVALILRSFSPLLARRRRAVFASLSARLGSIGDNRLGGWIGYRAAKAAQNQILRCAAIELARTRPLAIVVALHPGTIETRLTRAYADRYPTRTPAQSAAALLAVMDRLTPADSGGFFDWKGETVPW